MLSRGVLTSHPESVAGLLVVSDRQSPGQKRFRATVTMGRLETGRVERRRGGGPKLGAWNDDGAVRNWTRGKA